MNAKNTAKIFDLPTAETLTPATPQRTELLAIREDGGLLVRNTAGQKYYCDWLENSSNAAISLTIGDCLLCIPATAQEQGVALGRISTYQAPQPQQHLTLEATDSLTLKCGAAAVELRSDGRAIVKGEDVLLRAKGTQRIRAATVAIN